MSPARHGSGPGPLAGAGEYRIRLLAWFDAVRRDLPWRSNRTAYGTWISEVMLQQTTVRTVTPYFNRFLDRFPDVATLAAAPLDEVLALWSGLGYYRRARHLHAAARHVVEERGGTLPEDRAGWAALPGIGDYASGAIASMACGEAVPALDANANRVLTRWAVATSAQLARWSRADLRRFGSDLVDPDRPGDWNEAVMELGALVCTAADPSCGDCPMAGLCRAGASGRVDEVPGAGARSAAEPVVMALLVATWRDRILLLPPGWTESLPGPEGVKPARDDFSTLHQGLWSLPSTAWYPARKKAMDWPVEAWVPWLERVAGLDGKAVTGSSSKTGEVSHAITRYRIRAGIWRLDLPDSIPTAGVGGEPGAISYPIGEGSGIPVPVDARPGLFSPGPAMPPVSRLVTKGLSSKGLTKG